MLPWPDIGWRRGTRTRRTPDAAARGAQQPDADRAQAAVDQDQAAHRARVHRAEAAGAARGPAHRLRGSGLPQHLRVLGRPRGDVPDRRRPVHQALRLLPDRHRQARAARHRRAAPGRRVGGGDGAALRHRHRRGPRRPARRRRLAVRPDLPRDPRRGARLRGGAADPRLQRGRRAARGGVRRPPRGARAQHRDRAADLPPDQARFPLRAVPRGAQPGPRGRPDHEVQPDPRHGRGARRGQRGHGRPARRRLRPAHDHPVPAAVGAASPGRAVGAARGVRRAGRGGPGARLRRGDGRAAGALVLPRGPAVPAGGRLARAPA